MDKIEIYGGHQLKGTVSIAGAKNAALPLMCASLLTDQCIVLKNVPSSLSDIVSMAKLLKQTGVEIQFSKKEQSVCLQARQVVSCIADYDLVSKMRASILVFGPLLARVGRAKISLPGGCAIGPRPIDLHLKGMAALGADILFEDGYVEATAKNGLKGASIHMEKISVTGTKNLMMAATLAKGTTTIYNAACEPEVQDLAQCLIAMGGQIEGVGTSTLIIHGVKNLHGTTHTIIPDRIETGTYMLAAGVTGGELFLKNASSDISPTFIDTLKQSGMHIIQEKNGYYVSRPASLRGVDIDTHPYPGFPTDLQAQYMVLMCLANQSSVIHETIFENRFIHVSELCRLGAKIDVHHHQAHITPVRKLKGAQVMSTDLRASVSLILAGLVAKGKTTIHRVYHLDRGYEKIEEKLRACGAKIRRISHQQQKSVHVAS